MEQKNHGSHVIVLPYPSQGHINPLLQFAKHLASKGVKATLATTHYTVKSICARNIAVEPISDGFDDGGFTQARTEDVYLKSLRDNGSRSLSQLIEKYKDSKFPINCVVYDSFFPWALDVAKTHGIYGAPFFTNSASVCSIFCRVHHGVVRLPMKEEELPLMMRGMPPMNLVDLPSFVQAPESNPAYLAMQLTQYSNLDKADWVFGNSFEELEGQVVKNVWELWPGKLIGPMIPSAYLDQRIEDDKGYGASLWKPLSSECAKWLETKSSQSVIYVSFGSMVSLTEEQMEEMAWGLKGSNLDFIWVVRESEITKLPSEFIDLTTSGKGLIVTWCNQLEMLAHEAIGCFVTHCGWNSTLEGLGLGVPMVGVPKWAGLSQGSNHAFSQLFPQWQTSSQDENANFQNHQTEQAMNPMNCGKQVPFAMLLPVLQPQLDKDRAMQLHTLYYKLKKNEISKDGFVRHMRGIVGDQMLKMAVYKLQAQAARNSQTGPNQFSLQSQASAQQHHLKMPPVGAQQGMAPQSFAQLHQKGVTSPTDPSHIPSSAAQLKTDSSNAATDNNGKKSQEMESHLDSHGMPASQMSSSSLSNINQERERSTIPIQGLSKQQQQHLHFSQSSFPIYGSTGGNYGHPFSGTNVNSSAASLKQQPHDSQMRQGPVHQSIGATQLGTSTQVMNVLNVPNFERQNPFSEPKRVQGGTLTHLTNNSTLQQNSVQWQSSTSKEQKNCALSSMTHVKQEPVDQGNEQQHKSQLSSPQGLSSFSPLQVERGNAITGTLEDETLEAQPSRMSITAQLGLDPNISLRSQISSATPPVGPGNNVKTPPKKPSIGQKKPLESLGSSPPLPSKKQKLSGAFLDQSIEQLNDVTAVSGVNLREEEEQLFSGPKEDSRVSDASRRVVQEEEERLILQKIPLQKKLAEIMSKCGLKSMNNDVERCLSLCVEERMRGLIRNLIRLSKQRVNIEKPGHRTLITSDVQQQILAMNRKAREEWEKKQAEAEKLQKLNDPEGNAGVDGDKEKDDGRVKSLKANKEEDDKMRTTAANVAARAAVGGDDMLSKWQLMAEQARQKREGGTDAASGSQLTKDVSRKPLSSSSKNARDDQEGEKRGSTAAVMTAGMNRKLARNQVVVPQTKVARTISTKDVIAVLEREPQMSKSTLIYRLYEKMRAEAVAE